MDSRVRCVRCGEPIPAIGGEAGEKPVCPRCAADERTSKAAAGDPRATPVPAPVADDPPPVFNPVHPASPPDRTLTRTMLLPIPGMASGPPDAMIGRLEPLTLRWIELSDALQVFLGPDRTQLLQQSILQDIHPDDRALAEEEFRQACEHGERYDLVLRLKGRSPDWRYLPHLMPGTL